MTATINKLKSKDIQAYWNACKEHKLMVQRCEQCGKFRFYPGTFCTNCLSSELEWKEVSGRGTVYSYSIVYRPPFKNISMDVPYVVALIELNEGVRMMSNIVECPLHEISVGMKVQVTFIENQDEKILPKFKPILKSLT
jgi:uncharacterized OB-fold protein